MARVLLPPLLLFTVLCTVLCSETAVDIENKKMIIRRFEQCKGKRNEPMLFKDVVIHRDNRTNRDLNFDFNMLVRKEISTALVIIINFWKCDASGNPDSCEYVVRDYNVSTVCEMIGVKDEMWSQFIELFEPPLICPIKPGLYSLRGMPISTDILKFLPVSDAVWKAQLVGYDKGKEISCVEFEEQVVASYNIKH